MKRQILILEPSARNWQVETLDVNSLEKGTQEEYLVLSGESLCQYLLRLDNEMLIIARGPLPFLTGNKSTVGFISPQTGFPHYSYVGGRVAAQLLNLGIDAICLKNHKGSDQNRIRPLIVIKGCLPSPSVEFKDPTEVPRGQRSAFYWLIDRELDGDAYSGSILTIGNGAYLGYQSANLAAESIYHAGRGGTGAVFARFASALVMKGTATDAFDFFSNQEENFARNPNHMITPLIDKYCSRLSSRTGGTIIKLFKTGGRADGKNTLPALNARQLGYTMADEGDIHFLNATREGQLGCQWCQVHCRHYHCVPADYAPEGYDLFLDDFEPAYATHAMLGLIPPEDTFQARINLISDIDERLIQPIEQMGLDVIDAGLALSALLEGVERGVIPAADVPSFLEADSNDTRENGIPECANRLEAVVQAVSLLNSEDAAQYPGLRAIGDGPQALAEMYPEMRDVVFTCGKNTIGNPGHCNALWTFLMPFSRFFSHYSGQIYKIEEEMPPPESAQEIYRRFFKSIVERIVQREFFWIICNAFSQCAFTFVIFSQNGKGEKLRNDDLLVRILNHYGIRTTNEALYSFSEAFWAQSIDLKCCYGWEPPSAGDFPKRIYDALSVVLNRSSEELQLLMDILIEEWKLKATELLTRHGYQVAWI